MERLIKPILNSSVEQPMLTLFVGMLIVIVLLLPLASLQRDPSVDAFVPKDHVSYITAQEVEEVFGLADPIVVAVEFDESVFARKHLDTIAAIHERLSAIEGVRYAGVTSLASESYVADTEGWVDVRGYTDPDGSAADALAGFAGMPPHQGTLVSHDQRAAAFFVESETEQDSQAIYQRVRDAMGEMIDPSRVYIGGLGAITGFLSESISKDVSRLAPMTYVIVMLMLLFAFRDWKAMIMPLPVLIGSAGGALGLMALNGVPYYAITSALPVLLVAISVADTIHILAAFNEHGDPAKTARENALKAISVVLGPITITSLTTALGFTAIAVVSIMPPIVAFGLYAAVGILIAWLLSVVVVPALIVLLDMQVRRSAIRPNWTHRIARLRFVGSPLMAGLYFAALLLVGYVATHVTVDRSLVDSFPETADVHQADAFLNERFAGTAFLDVYVDSGASDGVVAPELLDEVARLQGFMETLPYVQKTVSIVDHLAAMHRALNDGAARTRAIGSTAGEVAEELFLLESGATPGSLSQEVDADQRRLLVRGILNSRYSSEEVAPVELLSQYLEQHFSGAEVKLSGRVNTRYHWMGRLGFTHVLSIALSILLVTAASALLFRSLSMGLLAVAPVLVGVLCVYAVMYLTGAYLEASTSMFAAISIGLGVDYAVHMLSKLRREMACGDIEVASIRTYRHVGRACGFNALGIGVGMFVLVLSELNTLKNFGFLIATATFTTFAAAALFLPSLYVRFAGCGWQRGVWSLLIVVPLLAVTWTAGAFADSGNFIARQIDERMEPEASLRPLQMMLEDRRGRSRERAAVVLTHTDGGTKRSLFAIAAPAELRDIAFLTHDFVKRQDQRWLFRPSSNRVRRLPEASRGDSFLGTDFSYADIKSGLKFDFADFDFAGEIDDAGAARGWSLTGRTKDRTKAKQLGFDFFRAQGSVQNYLPRRIDFFDAHGEVLKTIEVGEVEVVSGFVFAREIVARNHQSGHQTRFVYGETRLLNDAQDFYWQSSELSRGLVNRLVAIQ